MRDNVFVSFLIKTLAVTFVQCGLHLLSGKILLPIIFSGRHAYQMPKCILLAGSLSLCGIMVSHLLTYKVGLKGGRVIPGALVAIIITLIVLIILDTAVGGTFIRFSAYEHVIDYFSLSVVCLMCLVWTLPIGILYRLFLKAFASE